MARGGASRRPRKQAHSSRPAHGSIAAGRRFPRKRQEQRRRLQKKRRLAKKVMLRVTHQLIVQGPTEVTLEGLGSELPILEARVPCLHVGLVAARRNLCVRIRKLKNGLAAGTLSMPSISSRSATRTARLSIFTGCLLMLNLRQRGESDMNAHRTR